MIASNTDRLIAATAVAASLPWGIGRSASFLTPSGWWLLGFGLLAAACAWLVFCRHRGRSELRQLERFLDALDRLDQCDPATAGSSAVAPLPRTQPWRGLAQRVGQIHAKLCQRLGQLQQAQTAMEIRSQRAAAQCERIKTILSGVADPILVVNDYNELLLANPAAEQLFGFAADGAERRVIAELVRCEKLVELLTGSAQHRIPGRRAEEMEILDGNGQRNWYRVSTARLGDAEDADRGGRSGAVAVLRDISTQKAMQKRNAEFVSAVSHEMKAPLAGIRAYVELLVDGDAEDEATREEFLQVIQGQADRLQRLVENLLNLARIEAGVVQVNKRSRPLNELLEEAARVVQPSAEAKRIDLAMDLSPMYLGVLADRDMLLQAAINLLSNAVKYTPEGGRVTLRSRSADDEVLFEVEDTGVGLSDEDCQRVFEKFYRVKKDQKMASGTGLGLALAKHIVEDVHGGRLTVRSKLGAGSTFTVMLPKAAQMK